jgi:hypothetical protein
MADPDKLAELRSLAALAQHARDVAVESDGVPLRLVSLLHSLDVRLASFAELCRLSQTQTPNPEPRP